jgi:hypothetical protein
LQAKPGTCGRVGNYELAVPLLNGGLAHICRNNDDPNLPWTQTATFGTDLGLVDAVSLIQSNFSTTGNGPGNLVAVASGPLMLPQSAPARWKDTWGFKAPANWPTHGTRRG